MNMSRNSLLYLIFCFSILVLSACSGSKEIDDGRTAYDLKMYSLAPELLSKELSKEEDPYLRKDMMRMIAESYRFNHQYEKALEWYDKALREELDLDLLLEKGKTQMSLEDYEAAISTFDAFIKEERFDNYEAKRWKTAAQSAIEWKSEFTNVKVELKDEVSSTKADYAPALAGTDLVFTSTRNESSGEMEYPWTGEGYGDLFSVDRSKVNSANPEVLAEPINTIWYDGTATFNKKGDEIYFTRCGHSNEENDAYCQIYYAKKVGGIWDEPQRIELFVDTCNVGQPFLSLDGKILFYASDSREGYGGRDLFYSKKLTDGSWSTPYSLGRLINTPDDEVFPHVDETGTLYFSSNGHTGMGGLDLFTAEKTDKGWGNIQNMKSPINSGADDFGICITQASPANINDPSLKSGYFSSNRLGGKGDDDIYFFTYQNINTFEIILTVLEKDYADTSDPDSEILGTKLLSNVDVDVKRTQPKSGTGMDTTFEVRSGKLAFDAREESSYSLFVSKDGYLNKSTTATTIGKKTTDSIHVQVYVEVELEKIWPDYSFEIPNIYYDYNEATLRPESFPVLDSLLSFFFENPDITIEIGSHTDSRGSKSYNEELSQARAQSVVDYLTSKEVNAERLIAKGYGESKLVNECSDGMECTEEQHQRNRRTTFRIVSDDEVIESSNPDDVRVDPKN